MQITGKIFAVSVLAIMVAANARGADPVYVASQSYVDGAIENMEKTTNRVTTINSNSDDNHYPTAHAVFQSTNTLAGAIKTKEEKSNKVTAISADSTDEQYPSAAAVYAADQSVRADFDTMTEMVADELAGKEDVSNKTTTISSASTDKQYPSAKAVNDIADLLLGTMDEKEDTSNKVKTISSTSTDTQYPSARAVNTLVNENTDILTELIDEQNTTLTGRIDGLETQIGGLESTSNKVLTIDAESTDEQYPSAAAVWRTFNDTVSEAYVREMQSIDDKINGIESIANQASQFANDAKESLSEYQRTDERREEIAEGIDGYPSVAAVNSMKVELESQQKMTADALDALQTELTNALTTTIDSSSTNFQFPTAKAVYDLTNSMTTTTNAALATKEDKSNKTATIDASSTAEQYPTALAVYNLSETHVKTGADAAQTLAGAYTVTGSITVPDQAMPTADDTTE